MKRKVEFRAGFDCIRFECKHGSPHCRPGSGGSHGVHPMQIVFSLRGEEGAIVFAVSTGWLPKPPTEYLSSEDLKGLAYVAELSYHSKTPMYTRHVPYNNCTICNPCFSGYNNLDEHAAMLSLINGGDKALWKFLKEYYQYIYFDKPKPKPTLYDKPLRSSPATGSTSSPTTKTD